MSVRARISKTIADYRAQTGKPPSEIILNADDFCKLEKEFKHGFTTYSAKKLPPNIIIFEGVSVKKGK